MITHPIVSFEDTDIAFAYKSTADLRKANLLFSLVNHPLISYLARNFVTFALKARLPIEGIIKKTAFDHFCGGESIEESQAAIQALARYNVGAILDYSVEGEKSEHGFELTMQEILRTLEKARQSPAEIPFCVFKVTGLASAEVLQKINDKEPLSAEESAAFDRIRGRVTKICERAQAYGVPILIDAEDTWIQDPIDQLADEMMARFNLEKAIVYNTYQMYRTTAMDNLIHDYYDAMNGNYFLGAKLVRGAYMEKERARAEELNYPSPIHPDKEATDKAFNDALVFCVDHIARINVMCGS
ncbi:MAG: proline dehydrogenase family protein, partial [Bacteroidota bacterium]|nr:proline dehydrogenase family protein [Bacteroidota bacterium]